MNTKDTTEVAENSHHLKIFLPKKLLECLPRCPLLPPERLRWNTNEEIASYLITFEKHDEWLSCAPKTRPQNGSIILYNRKKVKYRKDGYLWKKRKDGKTTREDHMKLKVQGMEVRESDIQLIFPSLPSSTLSWTLALPGLSGIVHLSPHPVTLPFSLTLGRLTLLWPLSTSHFPPRLNSPGCRPCLPSGTLMPRPLTALVFPSGIPAVMLSAQVSLPQITAPHLRCVLALPSGF